MPYTLDPAAASLHVWFFGGYRLAQAGQPVLDFESDKARALLGYLLLEARPLRREQLAGLFWGALPESRARGNLSRVLSNLRTLLPGLIQSDRSTVELAPASPPWMDVWVLLAAYEAARHTPADPAAQAALRAALELYRGPLLAGFSLPGCPEFEEWLRGWQEHLHTQALAAFELQTAYHQQRGEWALALTSARRALALEPWRESAHRQVMFLLALQGEREQALHQYELCRQILATELGVAPAAETVALYQRLVAGDLTPPVEPPAPTAALPTPLASLPLVGRETAHAWLLTRWRAARHGSGGLTLLGGEAGIGKTRLIQEVLRFVAGQGGRIFSGRCYEFSRAVPYQAFYEALQPALAQTLNILPGGLAPGLPPLLPAMALPERTGLFQALTVWLRSQAGPTVIFLDDLHWADTDTLDLLHYLVRHLGPTPCWLIGTYRVEETLPDHPLTHLKQSLNCDGLLHTLTLTPLTLAEVTRLSAQFLAQPAATAAGESAGLAAYLYRESEGNPFLIVELLETLREQGSLHPVATGWELVGDWTAAPSLPVRVQDLVLQRVQRLDEIQQYLLTLAAAYGQAFDVALLATAGECPSETVELTLAEGRARHLIRPVAGGWDLAHDKIRAILYQAVPVPLRRLLHARLGAALEQVHPEEVALLAYHFDRAQQPQAAARYLLLAGDQARHAYALEQAGTYYRRGLELTRDAGMRYALLSGLETIYDLCSARESQQAVLVELSTLAAQETPEGGAVHWQAEVALRQAHYAEAISDYAAAVAAAARAVALALAARDDPRVAAGYRQWGYALRRQGHLPAAREFYERARDAAERAGAQAVLNDSLQGLANVAWSQGDYATARTYLEQSLALCQELGDRQGEADAYNILGIVWQRQGEWLAAQTCYRRALELRQAIGDRRGQALSYNNLGAIASELGDLTAARAVYTTAATLCREVEDRWGAAIAALGLAGVALDQGELEAAQHYATEGLAGLQAVGAPQRLAQARYLLGCVAQARGEGESAEQHFKAALHLGQETQQPGLVELSLSRLARQAAVGGAAALAYPYLEEALTYLARDPRLAGFPRPLRAHWDCYLALTALHDPRAETFLAQARALLQAQAAALPAPLAALFLTQIPEHQALMQTAGA